MDYSTPGSSVLSISRSLLRFTSVESVMLCMQTHIYRYMVCFSKFLQHAGLCTEQITYNIFFNSSFDLVMYVL